MIRKYSRSSKIYIFLFQFILPHESLTYRRQQKHFEFNFQSQIASQLGIIEPNTRSVPNSKNFPLNPEQLPQQPLQSLTQFLSVVSGVLPSPNGKIQE